MPNFVFKMCAVFMLPIHKAIQMIIIDISIFCDICRIICVGFRFKPPSYIRDASNDMTLNN